VALRRPFPHQRRPAPPPIRPVDLAVGAGILALLYGVLRLGRSMNVAFLPASVRRGVDEPRPPALRCGTVAPAHVHRPAPLGRVHLRLRHRRRPAAVGPPARSRRRPPRAEGRHRALSLFLQQIPVFPVRVPVTSLVLLFGCSLDRRPRSAQ